MEAGATVHLSLDLAGADIAASDIRVALLRRGTPGRMLHLSQAHIVGTLDLCRCSIDAPLIFDGCVFDQELELAAAELRSLCIRGGTLAGIQGRKAHLNGDLELCDHTEIASAIAFESARIDGAVTLRDLVIHGDGRSACDFRHATVAGDVSIVGETGLGAAALFDAATISGNLLSTGQFNSSLGPSFSAELVKIDGNVSFHHIRSGPLRLVGAHVGGRLHIEGGSITHADSSENALDIEAITVVQNLDVDGGLTIAGVINAAFAHIGAQLCLNGITLEAAGPMAVNGQGAQVEGDVYISDHSVLRGSADFTGASIHGDFVCDHASFTATSSWALNGERAEIGGSTFLSGSEMSGEARFMGAHIGGDFDCRDASIRNAGHDALLGRRMRVDKDVLLSGSRAEGTVDLVRGQIGGSLRCDNSTLEAPGGTALDLRGAQIGGVLLFTPARPPVGLVNLLDAHCAVLHDDASTWPERMNLDGFTYGSFDPAAPQTVTRRLDWLRRNIGGYSSRTYETLIGVYKAYGNEEDARRVALARQSQRTATIPWYLRPAYLFWGCTVGYGYSLRRLVPWLIVLLLAGTLAFNAAYPSEFVAKAKPTPTFVAFIYTLDLLVPVISLGQRDAWVTSGAAEALGWAYTVIGWVLGAAIVAGLTQLVRRS